MRGGHVENKIDLKFESYLKLDGKKSIRTDGFRCFCIKLASVEVAASEAVLSRKCQCQLLLYNTYHQQYVGNCWHGKQVMQKNAKITLNEVIYFYTNIPLDDLVLCIEFKSIGGQLEEVIGWTGLNLNDMKDNGSQAPVQHRMPLIFGSAVALLYMSGGLIEKLNQTNNSSGYEINVSVSSHPLLMRLVHLVPENYLISASAALPGLFQLKKDTSIVSDGLKRPQLQKCNTLVLSELVLRIGPSLQTFEAEVLKRMGNESDEFDELGHMTIVQRHLQVGIHNGLCYIQESDSYRLIVEPVITSQAPLKNLKNSPSSSTSYTREESLVVRSDIKIPNVPNDPNIIVIFVVEYGISFQQQQGSNVNQSSISRSQNTSVTLLWGACTLANLKKKRKFSMALLNHPSNCPNKTLFLRTSGAYNYTISFNFPSSSEKGVSSPHLESHNQDVRGGSETSILNLAASVPVGLHQLVTSNLGPYNRSVSHNILQSHDFPSRHQHTFVNSSHQRDSDSETMDEVDVVPSSLPLVAPIMSTFSGEHHLSRALHAKLRSLNFPLVYDQHGQEPSVIKTGIPYIIDEKKEISSVPEGSKYVFTFLGLSELSFDSPQIMCFNFQFYCFPAIRTENLLLKTIENSNGTSGLHLLYPTNSNTDVPGYQVSFMMDPSDLHTGEYRTFIRFLIRGTLCIDLLDAKSLLYYGTVFLPLKYLCRQGQEATNAVLDLDITHLEFPDDSPGPRIPVSPKRKGILHLQLTSVKTSLSSKSLAKLKVEINTSDSFVGNIETASDIKAPSDLVSNASPIIETNRELLKILSSRGIAPSVQDQSPLTEEKQRKMSRMDAIRSKLGIDTNFPSHTKDMQFFFKEREQDLLVIESYITRHKKEMIQNLLHSSVTLSKALNAIHGETGFFEFELTNPFDSDEIISISFMSDELSIVKSTDEWQFLKNLCGDRQKVMDNHPLMQQIEKHSLFLHSKETVAIPFKYQYIMSKTTGVTSPLKVFTKHCFTSNRNTIYDDESQQQIKITFESREKTLLSAINLKVQLLPAASVCQSFRFLSPEHSLFQKNMIVRSLSHQPHLIASDPDVVCEFLPQEFRRTTPTFLLKAPVGSAGEIRTFYIFIYEDNFRCIPTQTWKISVYSVHRVDISCIAGQATKSSLVLRGEQSSCLVRCFSNSQELLLHQTESFLLPQLAVLELAYSVCCLLPGVCYYCINMVDQSVEELLHSWILVVSCQKPHVTKAFQVNLHQGKELIKKISFQNTDFKNYILKCSHPHIVHLKDIRQGISGKKNSSLNLRFPPQLVAFAETVFLYICDEYGKNELTYCIKVNCE